MLLYCLFEIVLNNSPARLLSFRLDSYVFPVFLAVVAYLVRFVTDATCGATVCRAASEVFSHVYIVVVLFLLIVASTKAKQIKDVWKRAKVMMEAMTNEKNKKD